MKKDLVSIIVPVYNVEKYLSDCIVSICNQTYSQLEIILIDDGSTDSSGQICEQYRQIDNRIRVFHQKNAGAACAKNVGLDNASGEYICFVDSDDYISSDYIYNLIHAIKDSNADIIECTFFTVFKNKVDRQTFKSSKERFTSLEYLSEYIKDWKCSLLWNKLFRSSLLQNVRFKKGRRCIDDEFFTYKAVLNSKEIIRINKAIYYYRQRKSSVTNDLKFKNQKTKDFLDILIERYKLVTTRYPSLKKEYINCDISNLYHAYNNLYVNEENFKQLKKIARFYLKQSLLNCCSLITIYSIIRIQFIKKKKNNKELSQCLNTDKLFD